MNKIIKVLFCIPIACFSNHLLGEIFHEETLDNWPCTYLEREFIQKINPKEIHTIVELGAYNGLSAAQLNLYYKCPVFTFEHDPYFFDTIRKNISIYSDVQLVPCKTSDKTDFQNLATDEMDIE